MNQEWYTLQPGDIVLDYIYNPTVHTEALLKSLNVKAVGRYIAQSSHIAGKLTTDAEIAWLHSIGIGWFPIFESYASRPADGYIGGVTDGQFANIRLAQYKVPMQVPLVVADDMNVLPTTVATHLQYQRGFDEYCSWGTGPYGDNDIMQACVDAGIADTILVYAGARAWSNSNPPIKECHMEQTVKGSVQGVYDMNHVLLPFNVWLPHEVTITPQPPSGDDVQDNNVYTNSEIRPFRGVDYPPGAIKYVRHTDGRYRRTSGVELTGYGFTVSSTLGIALDNMELDDSGEFDPTVQNPVTVNIPPIVIPPIQFPTYTPV